MNHKLTKTQSRILPLDSNPRLLRRSSVVPRHALRPHQRKTLCRATTYSYSPIQHCPGNQNLSPLLWKWLRWVCCLLSYSDILTDSLKAESWSCNSRTSSGTALESNGWGTGFSAGGSTRPDEEYSYIPIYRERFDRRSMSPERHPIPRKDCANVIE